MLRIIVAVVIAGVLALAGDVGAAVVRVSPATQTLQVGDPLKVRIDIAGLGAGEALSAFDLNLHFDAALIAFTGAVFGDPALGDQLDLSNLGINAPLALAGPGTVNLIETSFDPSDLLLSDQAKEFTLAVLSFKTLAEGATPLSILINSLADAIGDPLAATTAAGSLTLTAADPPPPPPGVPEPWAWLLALTSVGAVFAPRRRFKS